MAYKVIECPNCQADCGAEVQDKKIKCENPQCAVVTFKVFEK